MSIDLRINEHPTVGRRGGSLFEHAEAMDIYVPTSCIKQGKCRECLMEVTGGMELLTPRSVQEEHLSDKFRLACRTRIVADSGTVRCHTLRRGEMRVERQAFRLPIDRRDIALDPCVTRDGNRILLDGNEIASTGGPIHGIAADIGTTTVVVRLLNLESGEIIADTSFENPQRFGGSDIMARIHFDTHHKGRLLQRTLCGYLSHAIEGFGVDPMSIYEMVVAGNSTMRDLFFGLDVHSIGQNPYQSITELELKDGKRTSTSLSSTPRRLSLPNHPKGRVYGLPIISGHVGADAAACMLAVDIANEERFIAVMDIGTNTELIVGNKHRLFAASCPAGPAFEGGRLSCGMPALPGAIERVAIDESGACELTVIGGGIPVGICGSGIVDLLGDLLVSGRMNSLGRFVDGSESFRLHSGPEGTIVFSESDINELAQAKGANVAGLRIVFKMFGKPFDALDAFYLAGGFGRHLNVRSARRIGLLPDIDEEKIIQVGNASIEGATIALLSKPKRAEVERLVTTAHHCRLESDPDFFHSFVEGCQFIPIDSPVVSNVRRA